jgi:hypothetical protein
MQCLRKGISGLVLAIGIFLAFASDAFAQIPATLPTWKPCYFNSRKGTGNPCTPSTITSIPRQQQDGGQRQSN